MTEITLTINDEFDDKGYRWLWELTHGAQKGNSSRDLQSAQHSWYQNHYWQEIQREKSCRCLDKSSQLITLVFNGSAARSAESAPDLLDHRWNQPELFCLSVSFPWLGATRSAAPAANDKLRIGGYFVQVGWQLIFHLTQSKEAQWRGSCQWGSRQSGSGSSTMERKPFEGLHLLTCSTVELLIIW